MNASLLCRVARTLALLVALKLSPAFAGHESSAVGPVVMVVGNLDRQLDFYTRVLPFTIESPVTPHPPAVDAKPATPAAASRSALLRLGDEQLRLVQFPTAGSRPIPTDSRSFDHWFQHIAIIVSDMDRAYERLRQHKVRHVSTLPQTLPDWNRNAAGIRAFYFSDPENHVLEILAFPPGKGAAKWHRHPTDAPGATNPLFLGIDHTAIVVADTDRSLAFYRDVLGLRVAGTSENWGTEQEHLNQVFGARLRITTLRADAGPGIELLEYLTPPGGRPLPSGALPTDLLAWRVVLRGTEGASNAVASPAVSSPDSSRLGRDPDGHLLEFVP